ncbi:MAG: Nif3-like dinuclear metal center hexameric protein [Spirochaetaceae bacterium]|jgi:dinuclear metal center YbgI/SA1388 family protein|nr:Nif3-like dinuclear metal center hexameric protein [Spirochaetaceae bacterium]
MTTLELDKYFRAVLDIDAFTAAESSLNGLQVDNGGAPVAKIAFAVDACMETFKRAREAGAGMLFVHHGLFWGTEQALTGVFRRRLQCLLDANLALYAAHLPLDAHGELGNNAALARRLGIVSPAPFGLYHGKKIGFLGALETPLSIHQAAALVSPDAALFPFGPERNGSCAVISGGGAMEVLQAAGEGVDLYVTGEAAHSAYHLALEGGVNMVCGGHYATEVWGLRELARRAAADLSIAVEFLDVPTGL